MISTYIFERNNLLRAGLKSFLEGTEFLVTAEFDCMVEVNDAQASKPPQIIICGLDKEGERAAEFVVQVNYLKACFPDARLVIMAAAENIRATPEILHCQADGYILSDINRHAIISYLHLAMIGEKVMPEPVALLFTALQEVLLPLQRPLLSERENDIVRCLILGESNKLIARHLEIKESTVKVHLKTILRKLGVQNRTQAALIVASQGNYLPVARAA
ncbi:MAG: LuxR C-terminal-related transcriptional regulator [Alphaproteobacteria bacterium]